MCWGSNNLGQGTVPADLGPVARLTAGASHNCAIDPTTFLVRCWGAVTAVPADLGTVVSISAAGTGDVTCAVTTKGTACW